MVCKFLILGTLQSAKICSPKACISVYGGRHIFHMLSIVMKRNKPKNVQFSGALSFVLTHSSGRL